MPDFKLVSDFKATGDQPQAIEKLVAGLEGGQRFQTLLGVTGSGKTFTVASVVEQVNRPTLVLAPNRTLAAQLCSEYKEFFPENAVEFFVSYYDYYQPEAYIPRSDTYIAKDADINDEIDKLRHAATRALFERRDVLIVASVSCIYGLGEPAEYESFIVTFKKGERFERGPAMRALAHAIWTMFFNLIGMGIGPALVGALSMQWQPSLGSDSLRYALLVVGIVVVPSALCFAMAARTLRQDLAAARG